MKKKFLFILAALFLAFGAPFSSLNIRVYNYGLPHQQGKARYVENQLLAKAGLRTLFRTPHLLQRFPAEIRQLHHDSRLNVEVIDTQPGCNLEKLKSRLLQERWFSRISYNYYRYAAETIPNDIGFPYQYALKNTGQPYGPYDEVGTRGADIKATLGWDWTTGSDTVVIAVIDTGVALNHEDLKNKMVAGYNFLAPASPPQDDEGHGTLVASVAAAETHNHIGIAGVCWKAKIMPLKVLDSSGQGNDLDIATAIQYAADHGAKVINMSLGGPGASFVLQDACRYAYEKGLVLVAATGNESSAVDYPAAFDAYVLAVGASDANDQLAGFSNYGPEVDVVAPGIWILGAYFDPDNPTDMQSYAWASGTSLSTPQVSGAAALLFSYKPFLTADQAMNLLRYTADDVNRSVYAGVDNYMGYGRINLQTLLSPYILKK